MVSGSLCLVLSQKKALQKLPKIDELLRREDVQAIDAPRAIVVQCLRQEVEGLRRALLSEGENLQFSLERVRLAVAKAWSPSIQRVVNATGVVLHTNLGRAPLSQAAVKAISESASGYCNLEYNVAKGARGSRHGHVTRWLCELTGAEDAVVVNNCAAAVMLGLAAFAKDKEVIVSRGELIEIGGSFRVPDVMSLSGATLIEVGTTNKTRASDYESAITEHTGMLVKVHRSNFVMVGFTEETSIHELASLGQQHKVPVMMDLGSGVLVDQEREHELGIGGEPTVMDSVASGADLVCFSGDKILGGPQCGMLVGKREAIEQCRKHPLMRAMRPDKLALVALEMTLRDYIENNGAALPVHTMLETGLGELEKRRDELLLKTGPLTGLTLSKIDLKSAIGGGTMPDTSIASLGLAVTGHSARMVDRMLRAQTPPVVGRIVDDALCLDLRTLFLDDDIEHCARALRHVDERLSA